MSGIEVYTKKEKFTWDIACMDIGVTFVALITIFAALFSVFSMPYSFSYVLILQMIALPFAILAVWVRKYQIIRWGAILLAGIGSYFYFKVNVFLGILPCFNSAIQLINKCYGVRLSMYTETAGYTADKISFLWIVCVLECLLAMVLLGVLKRGNRRFWAILVFLLPVLLGIFCGKLPDMTESCWLIGAIFLFLTIGYRREERIPIRALLATIVLLLLVWLAARPIESSIFSYKEDHLKEYKEMKVKLIEARSIDLADWIPDSFRTVKDKVEEMFPEVQKGVDWNKNLQDLDELTRTGKVLDEIVLASKPTDEVYWPIFEGYVYSGKNWERKGSDKGVYDTLTKVKALWPMKEYYDIERIDAILRDYFYTKNFKYTTNPKKIPEGMDFVEGFLFETREGFCVYFATAATVFYQMSDKEARYVEGYMLSPEDFEQQPDGTYKAIVTDYMAHAWCETYDARTDTWQVREHTLSSGLPTNRPTTMPTKEPTATVTPTAAPTTVPTKEPTTVPSGEPTQTPQEGEPSVTPILGEGTDENLFDGDETDKNSVFTKVYEIVKQIVAYVLGISFLVMALVTAIYLQRKIRVKQKKHRFGSKNIKKGILSIYREVQGLCEFSGLKDKEIWRREHLLEISEQFAELSQEEWEWLYTCVERTMFSNGLILTTEQKKMYQLYLRLRKGIFVRLTGRRKLWFLYGRAL